MLAPGSMAIDAWFHRPRHAPEQLGAVTSRRARSGRRCGAAQGLGEGGAAGRAARGRPPGPRVTGSMGCILCCLTTATLFHQSGGARPSVDERSRATLSRQSSLAHQSSLTRQSKRAHAEPHTPVEPHAPVGPDTVTPAPVASEAAQAAPPRTNATQQPPDCDPAIAEAFKHRLMETTCSLNTVSIDWGSSGWKVIYSHQPPADTNTSLQMQLREDTTERRFPGISLDTEWGVLKCLLDATASALARNHVGAHIAATAGFRESPDKSQGRWQEIRRWNEWVRLFRACDRTDSAGCLTVPGSQESFFEILAMLHEARFADPKVFPKGEPHTRYGMMSCGGASLQLAMVGRAELVDECVAHVNTDLNASFDVQRIAAFGWPLQDRTHPDSLSVASFSWLAVHDPARPKLPYEDDYLVGGANEMRATFDQYLKAWKKTRNPCVSSQAQRRTHAVCRQFSDEPSCIYDKFYGFISSLPGDDAPSIDTCREEVERFVRTDLMLLKFQECGACAQVAREVEAWGLATSFSRDTQFGVRVPQLMKSSEVLQKTIETPPLFETDETDTKYGRVLTATLLQTIFSNIGLNPDALVLSTPQTEVIDEEMAAWNLVRGWYTNEACPGSG